MAPARQASRARPLSGRSGWPATIISPSVAVSKPAASASQVDLPLPEGPRSSSMPPCSIRTSSKRSPAPPG
ncbi:MAG: hypothetical protein BWX79_02777 [Alphaproteobacteria bacterium ADurb.Bin100]|nr:MAG: hypothetical protein BWX79_02777 [Alphaproteobacteria bacterium ADurb.Bin100]